MKNKMNNLKHNFQSISHKQYYRRLKHSCNNVFLSMMLKFKKQTSLKSFRFGIKKLHSVLQMKPINLQYYDELITKHRENIF